MIFSSLNQNFGQRRLYFIVQLQIYGLVKIFLFKCLLSLKYRPEIFTGNVFFLSFLEN